MYRNKSKSILKLYREHTAIIVILFFLSIIAFFTLLIFSIYRNNVSNNLIKVLSNQSTLTQTMAKDSNRIFEIKSLLDVYNGNGESRDSLQNKMNKTLQDLKHTKDEYINQYNFIKQGYIKYDDKIFTFKGIPPDVLKNIFNKHDKLWAEYSYHVGIILSNENNMENLLKSTRYINENNQFLLKYNDDMASLIQEYNNNQTIVYINILTAAGILILIILALFIIRTYINVFLPMNQFYRGMTNVGINDLSLAIPKFKGEELKPLFYEVQNAFEKLKSLINIIEDLSKNVPFSNILDKIFNSFSEYVPYTYIGVALIEDNNKLIRASYAASTKEQENLVKRMIGLKAEIDSTSLGKLLKDNKARLINDLEEYVKGKMFVSIIKYYWRKV